MDKVILTKEDVGCLFIPTLTVYEQLGERIKAITEAYCQKCRILYKQTQNFERPEKHVGS